LKQGVIKIIRKTILSALTVIILFSILPLASSEWIYATSASGKDWNNPEYAVDDSFDNEASYIIPTFDETTWLEFDFEDTYASQVRFGTLGASRLTAVIEMLYNGKWYRKDNISLANEHYPSMELLSTKFIEKARIKIKNGFSCPWKAKIYWCQIYKEEPPTPTQTPTQSPSITPTPTPTLLPSPSPSPTPSPSISPRPSPSANPSPLPTPSPSPSPTPSPTPSPSPSPPSSPSPTPSMPPSPTITLTPTPSVTQTPILLPTPQPTPNYTPPPSPSPTPTPTPSNIPDLLTEGTSYDFEIRQEIIEGKPIPVIISNKEQEDMNWHGYIIELKADPLLYYGNEIKTDIERIEREYKRLDAKERETIAAKVLKTSLEVKKRTSERILKSQREQIEKEQRQLKEMLPEGVISTEQEFKNVFNGLFAEISERKAMELEKIPFVKKVYKNYKVKTTLMDSIPLIKADKAWNYYGANGNKLTGKGTTIAIIDTGVDYTHPDLGGCLGPNCKVIGGYDFVNKDNDPMDDAGHGTHCAGIAAGNGTLKGVAPEAKILAYKVLDFSGQGWSSDIIAAIERAIDPNQDGDTSDHADVISMSLGGKGTPDYPLSIAADNAVEAGVVVVVAAGNQGPKENTIDTPGNARKVITVGATYKKNYTGKLWGDSNPKVDQITWFSSRGPVIWKNGKIVKPDVVAPGAIICSARYDEIFPEGKHPYYKPCIDEKHLQLAGTSMATPMVAGLAALIRQKNPSWNPTEVKMAIRNTAKDLGETILTQGWGRIDALKAVQSEKPAVALLLHQSKVTGNTANIKGTALGNSFTLYYSKSGDLKATNWKLICAGTANISNNTLCNWDIKEWINEEFILKLTVKKGGQESVDYGYIVIENLKIDHPKKPKLFEVEIFPTWKEIEITGTVLGDGFESYEIEWCNKKGANCSKQGITLKGNGKSKVSKGKLGSWNPYMVSSPDHFIIRVRALYKNKAVFTKEVLVYVDPTLHKGWPKKIEAGLLPISKLPISRSLPTLADIDGDNVKDIVFAFGKSIYVLKHDGSNVKGWPVKIGGNKQFNMGPAVADIDKDGYNEIIVSPINGFVLVFNHDGTPLNGWSSGVYGQLLSIADVDKDGGLDIICANMLSGRITVVNAQGKNLPGWPIYIKTASNNWISGIAIADVDNDGYIEIATIVYKPSNIKPVAFIYLLEHDGKIKSGWPKPISGGTLSAKPVIADFDNDNELEIAFAGLNGQISIVNADGSNAGNISGPEYFTDLIAGDIDNDNSIEIIAEQDPSVKAGNIITIGGPEPSAFVYKREGKNWKLMEGFPIKKSNIILSNAVHLLMGNMDADLEQELSTHPTSWKTVAPGYLFYLYAYNHNGTIVSGFPKGIDSFLESSESPIGDIDGDGKNELIAITDTGVMYMWDLEGSASFNEWPLPRHDERHTNYYPLKSGFMCSDGTSEGTCSATKPYYCQNGTLIEKCTICGCPAKQTCNTENQKCETFCTPKTCSELNWQCGTGTEPNCNKTINCGTCNTGQTCKNHKCVTEGKTTYNLYIPKNGYFSIPLEGTGLTVKQLCENHGISLLREKNINTTEPTKYLYCIKNADYELKAGYAYSASIANSTTITITGTPWQFPQTSQSKIKPTNEPVYFGGPYQETPIKDIYGNCLTYDTTIQQYPSGETETIKPGKTYTAYKTGRDYSECTLGLSETPSPTPTPSPTLSPSPSPTPTPTPCTPKTCSELNWQCGTGTEPNCNKTINCGTCNTGQTCQNHKCTITNQYFSIPLHETGLTLEKLENECRIFALYYFDETEQIEKEKNSYDEPTYELQPGIAYYGYANNSCHLNLTGTPYEFQPINLEANKFKIIAATSESIHYTEIAGNCNPNTLVVEYGLGTEKTSATYLEPGKAYWVKSPENCTLMKTS